jgi:hypothetical protein
MTISPAGLPLWSRTASFEVYGGHLQKRDYGGICMVNALTDVSAAQFCRLTGDAAGAARVATLFSMSLSRSGSTITINYCAPQWAPPSLSPYDGGVAMGLYPVAALTDTNEVTVTVPSSATDEFGVAQAIVPRMVFPCYSGVTWKGGTIAANAFVLAGFVTGITVPLMVW